MMRQALRERKIKNSNISFMDRKSERENYNQAKAAVRGMAVESTIDILRVASANRSDMELTHL